MTETRKGATTPCPHFSHRVSRDCRWPPWMTAQLAGRMEACATISPTRNYSTVVGFASSLLTPNCDGTQQQGPRDGWPSQHNWLLPARVSRCLPLLAQCHGQWTSERGPSRARVHLTLRHGGLPGRLPVAVVSNHWLPQGVASGAPWRPLRPYMLYGGCIPPSE